jgi:hypothetical protein
MWSWIKEVTAGGIKDGAKKLVASILGVLATAVFSWWVRGYWPEVRTWWLGIRLTLSPERTILLFVVLALAGLMAAAAFLRRPIPVTVEAAKGFGQAALLHVTNHGIGGSFYCGTVVEYVKKPGQPG